MDNYRVNEPFKKQGLYDPALEHDNCGIGAVVNINGLQERRVVDGALKIVETLEHRAGKDAEGKTGDGVGILLQIPHDYFAAEAAKDGITLGGRRSFGIGMFFMPQTEELYKKAMKTFEDIIAKEGMRFLGWRKVPVNPSVLGSKALDSMPTIMQGFVERPADCKEDIDFDRKLYVARRLFEKADENTYVCSLSCRTIVYKAFL